MGEKEESAPKKNYMLSSLIDKIKADDRWDYDIKFDDDEEEDDDHGGNDNNLLSVAVDSKFKRGNSLVDILMEGPQKLFEKGAEDEKDQNEEEKEKEAAPKDDNAKEEESTKDAT